MQSIKSYSDLEQSKKLAEILPLESADMWYDNDGESIAGRPEVRYASFVGLASKNIPCWSLAALLAIIPEEVEIDGQHYAPCAFPVKNRMWIYKLWYNSNGTITSPISIFENNLVDACYNMVLKLHELNLL